MADKSTKALETFRHHLLLSANAYPGLHDFVEEKAGDSRLKVVFSGDGEESLFVASSRFFGNPLYPWCRECDFPFGKWRVVHARERHLVSVAWFRSGLGSITLGCLRSYRSQMKFMRDGLFCFWKPRIDLVMVRALLHMGSRCLRM